MAVALYDPRGNLIEAPAPVRDWRDVQIEMMQETLLELEQAAAGWVPYGADSTWEFTRQGLRDIITLSRLMYLKNPLINRAVDVQRVYVWGQDWNVQAVHAEINDVVQAFLDDKRNRAVLTSQQAREQREVDLINTGNLFIAFFVNKSTGRVRVQTIPVDEIDEILTNPNDRDEPWFYKRVWSQTVTDFASGASRIEERTTYYPDWQADLRDGNGVKIQMPNMIGGKNVERDIPVFHVRVGGLSSMRFGVPEMYSALDWATAVKDHLTDWAAVWRALNQFAWQLKTQRGARGVAAAKARIGTTIGAEGVGRLDTNPPSLPGSTFVSTENVDMTPFRTAGVRPSPEEARTLGLMVAAGVGVPETILFGNADVGNLATAKTLDRPTELRMLSRRALWVDVFGQILDYVIDWAVRAPNGKLAALGRLVTDDDGDLVVEFNLDPESGEPINRHIDVTFPDLLERSVTERVEAIVAAATLNGKQSAGTMTPKLLAELLMAALGIDDIDEVMAVLFPEGEGEIASPSAVDPEGNPIPSPVTESLAEAAMDLRAALAGLIETESAPAGRVPRVVRRTVERDGNGLVTAVVEREEPDAPE